jgi:hypothetical protein
LFAGRTASKMKRLAGELARRCVCAPLDEIRSAVK